MAATTIRAMTKNIIITNTRRLKTSKYKVMQTIVVHCKKQRYDVYIGRPSKWGNLYTHIKNGKTSAKYIVGSREEAIKKFREWILYGEGKYLLKHLHELKGKVLGCWCKPQPCHGDVLIELIDKLL